VSTTLVGRPAAADARLGSRIELPASRARAVQLGAAAAAGAGAAWIAPGWATPLLFFTAMLAGISSLWSP
jgi:hypothetical protein